MPANIKSSPQKRHDTLGLATDEEGFPERELSEAEAKRLQEIIDRIKRDGCKFDYFDPAELLEDD